MSEPVALDLAKRAECFRERNLRIGPVQQKKIDLAQAQPRQRFACGPIEFARRKMRGPNLRGDEDIAALHARCTQPLADLAFIVVHLGRVDVAIAKPQRLLDCASTDTSAQIPCAKTQDRDARTLRFNNGDVGDDRVHTPTSETRRASRHDRLPPSAAKTASGAPSITLSNARA